VPAFAATEQAPPNIFVSSTPRFVSFRLASSYEWKPTWVDLTWTWTKLSSTLVWLLKVSTSVSSNLKAFCAFWAAANSSSFAKAFAVAKPFSFDSQAAHHLRHLLKLLVLLPLQEQVLKLSYHQNSLYPSFSQSL
jgi:hypothetical protein